MLYGFSFMPKITNWSVAEKSDFPRILAIPKDKTKKAWEHDNSTTFVVILDQRRHGLGQRRRGTTGGKTAITQGERYRAVVYKHRDGRNSSRILAKNDNLDRVKDLAKTYMREHPEASLPR